MDCASFITARRFYLSKRIAARLIGELALSATWHHHQDQQPHTLLPADFPAKAKLESAGYTAIEDLEGASVEELLDWASLSTHEAEAALAAYAAI